jgi:ClpP class serine protease
MFVAMNDEKDMPEISGLDSFLLSGRYEINREYAIEQFGMYLENVNLLNKGIPYEKLGVEKALAQKEPTVISVAQNGFKTIGDSDILRNTTLTPRGSIAHLKLSGTMRSSDYWCNRGVDSLVEDFQAAYQNDHIMGIVLEANTGGGESVAGQMLQSIIQDAPKPVVVFAHYLASAGIMGTLSASEIIASTEAASFGSIGTYITIDKRIGDWYSKNYQDIYASKSTNKNRAFRALQKGDVSAIQEMVDVHNENFLEMVQKYRPLNGTRSDVAHTLSGEMFNASESKYRGLIDGVGSFQYALKRVTAHAQNFQNIFF